MAPRRQQHGNEVTPDDSASQRRAAERSERLRTDNERRRRDGGHQGGQHRSGSGHADEQQDRRRTSRTRKERTADYVGQQSAIQQYTTDQYQYEAAQQEERRQQYVHDFNLRQAQERQQWLQYQNNQIAMFQVQQQQMFQAAQQQQMAQVAQSQQMLQQFGQMNMNMNPQYQNQFDWDEIQDERYFRCQEEYMRRRRNRKAEAERHFANLPAQSRRGPAWAEQRQRRQSTQGLPPLQEISKGPRLKSQGEGVATLGDIPIRRFPPLERDIDQKLARLDHLAKTDPRAFHANVACYIMSPFDLKCYYRDGNAYPSFNLNQCDWFRVCNEGFGKMTPSAKLSLNINHIIDVSALKWGVTGLTNMRDRTRWGFAILISTSNTRAWASPLNAEALLARSFHESNVKGPNSVKWRIYLFELDYAGRHKQGSYYEVEKRVAPEVPGLSRKPSQAPLEPRYEIPAKAPEQQGVVYQPQAQSYQARSGILHPQYEPEDRSSNDRSQSSKQQTGASKQQPGKAKELGGKLKALGSKSKESSSTSKEPAESSKQPALSFKEPLPDDPRSGLAGLAIRYLGLDQKITSNDILLDALPLSLSSIPVPEGGHIESESILCFPMHPWHVDLKRDEEKGEFGFFIDKELPFPMAYVNGPMIPKGENDLSTIKNTMIEHVAAKFGLKGPLRDGERERWTCALTACSEAMEFKMMDEGNERFLMTAAQEGGWSWTFYLAEVYENDDRELECKENWPDLFKTEGELAMNKPVWAAVSKP